MKGSWPELLATYPVFSVQEQADPHMKGTMRRCSGLAFAICGYIITNSLDGKLTAL
jgi:hypothetical protein